MNSMQLLGEAQFHGAKWLASSKYRFYWASVLIIFFCFSLSVLSVLVNRYFQNPTYIAQYDVTQPMKQFPTVILCPEVEFPQYKINKFLQNLTFPTGINASYIDKVLPQLGAFFSPDVNYVIKDMEKIQYLLDYNNLTIETAGKRLTLNCKETITRCRWLNKNLNCSSAFRFELTSYGFCCIFNGFSLKREIKDHGIANPHSHKKLYVNSIGFTNSLMIAVNQSLRPLGSLDLSYKWLVLQTAQYVDIIYNGTAISPSVETWAGYTTTTLHVTDDAERLGDELRHCRMVHEPLRYFPIYHKRYCLLECEMERVRQQCNCVQIVYPRVREHDALPICTAKHLACVRQAADGAPNRKSSLLLTGSVIKEPYHTIKSHQERFPNPATETCVSFSHGYSKCRCPPSCDSEIETSILSSYDLIDDSQEFDDFYADLDFDEISIIRVFIFKHNRKVTSRYSFFPFHNLFSQLGGVFGVFFGCSILSLLEMVQLMWYGIRGIYCQRQATKKQLPSVKNVNTAANFKK